MRNPTRVLLWMGLFLAAVVAAGFALREPLLRAFLANPVFNGMILSVLLVGVLINFRQVLVLNPEARWLDEFRRGDPRHLEAPRRGLLASAARILTRRGEERIRLSAQTMRALLDGIRSRLDESRDLARYVVGLLIFLGLLGTFWGLLDTLSAVSGVISGLTVGGGGFAEMFEELKQGLRQPLAGMGTAFSSSLFGLAGALVLGFFDLQAGHAQNRFYNDLEEWLAGLTHVSGGPLTEEEPIPVYVQALLEQTADALDKLQRVVARNQEEQHTGNQRIAGLVDELRAEQRQLGAIAKSQAELPGVLAQLATELGALRETSQALHQHFGNIDNTLTGLASDLASGRSQTVEELRDEIRLLARTVAKTSHPT